MRLGQCRVKDFRSVVDSGTVRVADIAALIGANESGKTSNLQGLASISMDWEYEDFDLTELDGVLKKYTDRELEAGEIEIVRANFSMSSDDQKALNDIIQETGNQRDHLQVHKFYDAYYQLQL